MVTVGRDGATLEGLTLPRSDMVPRCCDNGRPVVTDPHTGQTICSCQYGSGLLAYPRVPTLGDAVYGTSAAYAAAAAAQSYVPLGADGSAFYSPLTSTQFDSAKEAVEGWRHLAHTGGMYFPYDTSMAAAYSYGPGFGPMDLNAARRKNATKEATNTLKAWLYEHRKNPYPTKGEKIMLAIITKMTLTQVSTWFANARRRLKKENKMTWSPRNRSDDDGDDFDDLGDDDKDVEEREKMEHGSPGRSTPHSPANTGRQDTDKLSSIDIGESSDDHVTVDDMPASPLPCKSSTKERSFSTDSQTMNGENRLDNENSLSPVSSSFSPTPAEMCSSRIPMDKLSSSSKKSESVSSHSDSSPRPKIWSVSQFLPTNSSTDNHRSRESAVTSALSLSTSHPYHMTSSPAHRGLKSPGQNHSYLSSVSGHTNYNSPLSYVTHPLPITLGNTGLPFPYSLPSVKSTLSSPSTTMSRHEALMASAGSSLRPSIDIQRELSRQAGALDMRNTSPIS